MWFGGSTTTPRQPAPPPTSGRPAPPARPGPAKCPGTTRRPGPASPASPAPTCGPLSPGDDVFPESLHCPVPGHLLVSGQALGQLDLWWELRARNHGERRGPLGFHDHVFPPERACDVTRLRRSRLGVRVTSRGRGGLAHGSDTSHARDGFSRSSGSAA